MILFGLGIVIGFVVRGLIDNALITIAIRIFGTAIGKEKVAEAMAKVVAGKGEA
jgi:hypothetical protein